MNNEHKLATLIPMEEIEGPAQDQIQTALNHDWLLKLAIMPDVHTGYDLPIGAVALTDGIISPSFVGYDLGCGMASVYIPDAKLAKKLRKFEFCSDVKDKMLATIPCGKGIVNEKRNRIEGINDFASASDNKQLTYDVNTNLRKQHGTLGAGNHFIEIGLSENDPEQVVMTVHSGSRKPGWDVGAWYMKKGKYLELASDLGKAYQRDLDYMLDFALSNRKQILRRVLSEVLAYSEEDVAEIFTSLINENHNHAVVQEDGSVLHRKGATPADAGQFGIIPGSMLTGVYITEGLGNETYLSSASHGAGRRMSRTRAFQLDLDTFKKSMKGIAAVVSEKTLDEDPRAYKDLNTVLAYQEGKVVKVVDRILPKVNVKG